MGRTQRYSADWKAIYPIIVRKVCFILGKFLLLEDFIWSTISDYLFLLQFCKRKHKPTSKLTNLTLPTSTEKLSNNRTWVRKKIKQQTQKSFPVRHDIEHHKLKIQK